MDQERWKWAQAYQQLSFLGISANSSANESEDGSSRYDRYKSDMEQALAMQADRRRIRQVESKNISAEDIDLGIKGLDQARIYAQSMQFKSALKLYELSLELLVMVLSKDGSIGLPAGITRAIIESRVRDALSEAEKVKIILKGQPTSESTKESTNQQKVAAAGTAVSSALVTALQRIGSPTENPSSRNRPAKGVKIDRKRATGYDSSNALIRNQGRTARSPVLRNTGRIDTSIDMVPFQSETHQTILQDFFITPGNLQKTTWNDIAGLENVKQALQEAAILPLIRPDLFTGLRKPRNILLYGPPGTGKTMLVKAVANESQSNLFIVTSSALTSKWMGEAEKLVRSLFEVANSKAPSIIFIDEMDALLSARKSDGEHEASRRLKTEFMVQIDGIVQQRQQQTSDSNVLLLACTNCPWDIDPAVLRRFPRRIYVPLPDVESRKALLEYLLKNQMGKHSLNDRQISSIVQRTDGYSCSDITAMASEAAFGPIRALSVSDIRSTKEDDMRPVEKPDFDIALQSVSKSVSPVVLKKYDEWNKQQQATSV